MTNSMLIRLANNTVMETDITKAGIHNDIKDVCCKNKLGWG